MDLAIRWSQNSDEHEQRFLVVDLLGRSIKTQRVTKYTRNGVQSAEISKRNNIPKFRAFDWSVANEDLVAVGGWTGITTVLSLKGRGTNELTLPVRSQRQCNSVGFNANTYLATALERVRADFCLNVYDVNQTNLTSSSGSPEPVRKFASSEGISSIKFFPRHPNLLAAGVRGTCVRLYDLRQDTASPALQYATSCVNNLTVDPQDHYYFASAGSPRDPIAQIWDIRCSLRSVNPSMSSGLSSNEQDGPVLELKPLFDVIDNSAPANLFSLRYCPSQAGCLGVLSSVGQVRIYQTRNDPLSSLEAVSAGTGMDTGRIESYLRQIHVNRAYNVKEPAPLVGDQNPVNSFDFTNLKSKAGTPCTILLHADQQVHIQELQGIPSTLSTSTLAEIAISQRCDRSHKLVETTQQLGEIAIVTARQKAPVLNGNSVRYDPFSHVARLEHHLRHRANPSRSDSDPFPRTGPKPDDDTLASGNELSGHMTNENSRGPTLLSLNDQLSRSDRQRHRASQGYLFDSEKNSSIVGENPFLQELWRLVQRFHILSADDGMVSDDIDFSYVGLAAVWNGDLGRYKESRARARPPASHNAGPAIKNLANRFGLSHLISTPTSKHSQRQLCLHIVSHRSDGETLRDAVQAYIGHGQIPEAAFVAMLNGQERLALEALGQGKVTPEMTSLSLLIRSTPPDYADKDWQTLVLQVHNSSKSHSVRAITRYLYERNWSWVLHEPSLALPYRIAVALHHLSDDEVSAFFADELRTSIEGGFVEGILLTGLNEQAMQLFTSYIARTDDLQTAVLAMSFAAPRFVHDPQFLRWREEYRAQLNRWRLFFERVRFDSEGTMLATTWEGQCLLKPRPRRIALRCLNCEELRSKSVGHAGPGTGLPAQQQQQPSILLEPGSGAVACPACGTKLSRCVICERWIGDGNGVRGGNVGPTESGISIGEGNVAVKDPFGPAFVQCLRCGHVSHKIHSDEWFVGHSTCPLQGCDCQCRDGGG
ncbi:hypothetical protein MMC25_000975 [Agyrium rufum]|nr:hypothetical protein [Agyrium rufum]